MTTLILNGHADAIQLTVEQVREIESATNHVSIGYRAPDLWQPVNPERLMHPAGVGAYERIDIKLRDGTIFYNRPAYAWCWGEAFETTITHWRYAK